MNTSPKWLVAVDGSSRSFALVRHAARLALETGQHPEVLLLHVLPTAGPNEKTAGNVRIVEQVQIKKNLRAAAELLDELCDGKVDISSLLTVGDVRERIVETAHRSHTDHIFVGGSAQIGALKKYVSGSISQFVEHQAGCPVTIVTEQAPMRKAVSAW